MLLLLLLGIVLLVCTPLRGLGGLLLLLFLLLFVLALHLLFFLLSLPLILVAPDRLSVGVVTGLSLRRRRGGRVGIVGFNVSRLVVNVRIHTHVSFVIVFVIF